MNFTLIFSALLMGVAGSLHCVVMCGPSSAAAIRACGASRPSVWGGFHLGRMLGYAAAGAAAAGSVMLLAQLGQWSPALKPLWTLAHMAGLGLGLTLLWQGQQPKWLDHFGRAAPSAPLRGWRVVAGPMRAGAIGMVWFAWPCGLLQSALLISALANGPAGGAAVMAVFALASSPALGLGPQLWSALVRRRVAGAAGERLQRGLIRFAGALLVGSSAWALGQGLWVRVWAYCVS